MRRLVVNADDFGWSRSVNAGIVEAHRTGIVTRASLLATGAGFDDAVRLAKETPTLGLGVHLNFYRAATLLPRERVASLTGPDGRLLGSWKAIVGRLATGRFDRGELEAELRAQIERFLAAGLTPGHLDSEKHLHLWPSVFDTVVALAVDYGIPEVRVVTEPYSLHPILSGLHVLSARDRAHALAAGRLMCDGTVGVTHAPTEPDALERLLADARGERVELVTHPGHIDAEFLEMQCHVPNRLVGQRELEFATLAAPAARDAVERAGFELERASRQ